MYGIIGSGFGLYGYLPALLSLSNSPILLLDRSREKFFSRRDLIKFHDKVLWCSSVNELINQSSDIVIAIPPGSQENIIEKIISEDIRPRIIIEKPIGRSPKSSIDIANHLSSRGIDYRVGYTFIHTLWARHLASLWKTNKFTEIEVIWSFRAYHYLHKLTSWKSSHEQGGGVLRFYGIQITALAAMVGFTTVMSSSLIGPYIDDYRHWRCKLVDSNLRSFNILLSVDSPKPLFEINLRNQNGYTVCVASSKTPFYEPTLDDSDDNRIVVLQRLIKSFADQCETPVFYLDTLRLWADIEQHSLVTCTA